MNVKATRRYEMLVRVLRFRVEHAAAFCGDAVAAKAFAAVRSAIRKVERAAASHMDGHGRARERAASKAVAAKALVTRLARLRLTARALDIDTPGLERAFRLPRPMSHAALLFHARSAVDAARERASLFVGHGLPRTFIDELEAYITAFEHAEDEQQAGKYATQTARGNIEASLRAGALAARRLDAIVANVLCDDAMARAAWETARRIPRSRGATAAPAAQAPDTTGGGADAEAATAARASRTRQP